MGLRTLAASFLRRAASNPLLASVLARPAVRRRLLKFPVFDQIYAQGWIFRHPIDQVCGTDTSGFIPSTGLPSSPIDVGKPGVYAGSQPSIIRSALNALPVLNTFTFVDVGCGKGRPLMVASEYPFHAICGVEIAEKLVTTARKNISKLKRRYPTRTSVTIELQDVSSYNFPSGDLVVFLYNPFGAPVMQKVIERLELTLDQLPRTVFVIYYNPLHGHLFDTSPKFARYYAATMPYSAEEMGYGPDSEDTLVIWQAGCSRPPHPGSMAAIRVTRSDVRAELESR